MRSTGYNVTIKLFIPSPRDDFKAQAAAASLMATITEQKIIPDELRVIAHVLDVAGRFGSVEIAEEPIPDVEEGLMDDPATEKPTKRGKQSAATE